MEISTFIQDVAAERYPKEYWGKLPYLEEKTLRMKANTTFLFNEKVVFTETKVILIDGENFGEVFEIPFRGYIFSQNFI